MPVEFGAYPVAASLGVPACQFQRNPQSEGSFWGEVGKVKSLSPCNLQVG